MKIDREELMKMCDLPDQQFWKNILQVAEANGLHFSDMTPKSDDLNKLRRLLRGEERIKMSEAFRLLNEYKRKYGKENS